MGIMDFKDAVALVQKPEPVVQHVAVGDVLFGVEVSRLPGADWAAVMADCPPGEEAGARLGYDTTKAALVACRRYSRLLDAEGEPVEDVDWAELFEVISGTEVAAIASIWWALNMHDPNQRVVALKKALAGGGKTS